jgi:hypothetical protein
VPWEFISVCFGVYCCNTCESIHQLQHIIFVTSLSYFHLHRSSSGILYSYRPFLFVSLFFCCVMFSSVFYSLMFCFLYCFLLSFVFCFFTFLLYCFVLSSVLHSFHVFSLIPFYSFFLFCFDFFYCIFFPSFLRLKF